MKKSTKTTIFELSPLFGCLTMLAIGATIGAACFDYLLWNVFGKDIPWYADVAAGLVLGQISIPLTVIMWVIKLCGVGTPLIG